MRGVTPHSASGYRCIAPNTLDLRCGYVFDSSRIKSLTSSRREHLQSLLEETRTMIFYEAPHKLLTTLGDMQEAFGPDRPICLCRELTKLHEEAVKTTIGQALAHYQENSPRGEYVLIVGGAAPKVQEAPSIEDCIARVNALRESGLSMKDAVKQVSKEAGIPRNTLYDAALQSGS